MMSFLRSLSHVFILGFACPLFAHPAFQHHFNNIVDSNPCLKSCMDQATESDTELSLLKTANVTGFLLDLNRICSIISTARACISDCKIDSNPFALESMVVLCNQESLTEVASVSKCLQEKGDSVLEECRGQCDDYEQINDQVHHMTQALPKLHRPAEISKIMEKIGEACAALTCSDRCTVRELSQQCIGDGIDAGAVVKSMVQKVLIAQRRDLERMRIVETLAQSTPAQCMYMYVPEIMFDPSKEKIAQSVAASGVERHMPALPSNGAESDQKQELSLALSQLQAHLLKKQIRLLDLQEKNLMRETQKLDLEFQLLLRKKARSDRFFN